MSQLDQIETFVQVVEQNSFAGAAKNLGISAAAVSKQVNALENRLGVQLLTRSTRKISLTEIGTNYYHQCQRVLNELHEADSVVSHVQQEPAGVLRVAASSHFGERYIVPYISEFMERYPQVLLHLDLAERFPDLARENIDVLVGIALDGPPELVRRKIGSACYSLCATPEYFKKYGMPKKPTDLEKHRYIEHSIRKPSGHITFSGGQSINLKPILLLNNTKEMIAAALQDIGIIKVHSYAVDPYLEEGKLVRTLYDFRDDARNVYLYYQQSRFLPRKIRCFIDFLLEKMEVRSYPIVKKK